MHARTYSAIIPSYNRRDTLVRVVDALQRQDAPELVCEVIVVDDGGSDGAADAVEDRRWDLPVRVIRQQRGGPSAARNRGVAVARGEVLLFLCDDIEAEPHLLRRHEERRSSIDGPHCVVGRVDWPPTTRVTPFMRFVTARYHFGFEQLVGMDELPFDRVITANFSIHRELLLSVGGFDEGFPYGFEDTDLGLRLMELPGMRILYAPEALGRHHHTIDVAGYCRRQEALGPSAVAFSRRHPSHPEVTRLDRVPRWGSAAGIAKRIARNPLTRPLWYAGVQAAFRLGATRAGETLCHQLFAYHYYRGVERAIRAGRADSHEWAPTQPVHPE